MVCSLLGRNTFGHGWVTFRTCPTLCITSVLLQPMFENAMQLCWSFHPWIWNCLYFLIQGISAVHDSSLPVPDKLQSTTHCSDLYLDIPTNNALTLLDYACASAHVRYNSTFPYHHASCQMMWWCFLWYPSVWFVPREHSIISIPNSFFITVPSTLNLLCTEWVQADQNSILPAFLSVHYLLISMPCHWIGVLWICCLWLSRNTYMAYTLQ